MPANQSKIKANLAAWLRFKLNQDISEEYKIIRNKDLIKDFADKRNAKLAKLIAYLVSEGHCFGFSIARGAMVAIGKREWWDELLDIVETTSVPSANFNKKITLKNADNETTLEEIFFKALYYVVPTQVSKDESETDFLEKGVNQLNLLEPDKNRFQLLGKLPELKLPKESPDMLLTSKDRKVSGGNLSHDDAVKLLNLSDTNGKICLLLNYNHAIQFDMENGKFNIYNPNYVKETYKVFNTKEEFLNEVIIILGSAFVFYIVSLDKKLPQDLFSHYNKLIKEKSADLLRGYGLLVSLEMLPEQIDAIITDVCASTNVQGPDYIAESLVKNTGDYNTLLYLALTKPLLLPKLLTYAKKSKKYSDSIAAALSYRSDTYSSVFSYMIVTNNTLFTELLADAEKSTNWSNCFLSALSSKDKKNITALAKIIDHNETNLSAFFELAAKHELVRKFIVDSLSLAAGDSWIMFHLIINQHPESLPILLKLIAETKNGCDELAKSLAVQTSDGWSGLHMLIRYAPSFFIDVLKIAEKSTNFADQFAKALIAQTDKGSTALHLLDISRTEYCTLMDLGDKSATIANAITCALLTKNKDGLKAISRMPSAVKAKKFLHKKQYISTVFENEAVFEYVTESLIDSDEIINEALMQIIHCGDKAKLIKAITFAEKLKNWPDLAAKIINMKKTTGESVFSYLLQEMYTFSNSVLSSLLRSVAKSKNAATTIHQTFNTVYQKLHNNLRHSSYKQTIFNIWIASLAQINESDLATHTRKESIAGNFSVSDVCTLLDEKNLNDNHCLVYSRNCILRITFEFDKYIGYFPEQIIFDTKEDLVKHMISFINMRDFSCGDETTKSAVFKMELITTHFDKESKDHPSLFSSVDQLVQPHLFEFIKGKALCVIGKETPERLAQTIKSITESKDESGPEKLVDILMDDKVIAFLIDKNHLFIADILSYVAKSEISFIKLVEFIFAFDNQILKKSSLCKIILTFITNQLQVNSDTLPMLDCKEEKPDILDRLFIVPEISAKWFESICEILSARNVDNKLVILNLIKNNSPLALRILNLIALNPEGAEIILRLFALRDEHKNTVIDTLMSSVTLKKAALNIFKKSLTKQDANYLKILLLHLQKNANDLRSDYYYGPMKSSNISRFFTSKNSTCTDKFVEILSAEIISKEKAGIERAPNFRN